jgi:hypothetical protein
VEFVNRESNQGEERLYLYRDWKTRIFIVRAVESPSGYFIECITVYVSVG